MVWLPIQWPSTWARSASLRRAGSASFAPSTKNVARMCSFFRTSSTCSVTPGSGPLSNVRVTSGLGTRHENEPLEEVDVLLVLQQRPVQRRDDGLAVLGAQRFGRDVLGKQQLQPVEELGGGRLFLQPGHRAHLEEHFHRLAQQRLLQVREVHPDDLLHRFLVGETDVVEEAAPQERVWQLLLVVRGDEYDRPVLRLDELARLVAVEVHAVELT